MFVHIFTYRLKCLLRDRETVFWTLMFPIVLAVFFNMAFSSINKREVFQAVNIAVVDNGQYRDDISFRTAMEEVSKGDDRLFNLTVAPEQDAERMLEDNSIAGYIIAGNPPKLVVKKSGMNQSIIKSFLDNYVQTASAVKSILAENPEAGQKLLASIGEMRQYVREVPGTSAKPDNVLYYFYTLIAMACLYGGFFGMREIADIQADISPLAARVNIAPVHKLKAFLYSVCATFLVHVAEMLTLLAFLRFVIKADFGSKTGYILLTTAVGSAAGIAFGALVSAIVKKSENMKVGVILCISMIGSFLAGMMFQGMKYIVAKNAPVLSWLNPINLLTDAFYCLYYYDGFSRYFLNLGALLIFIFACCSGIYLMIRRRRYASL
ncbi:MAG: ABC transporter permease [Bacillota bacterium]